MTAGRLAGAREFAAYAEIIPDAIIIVDGASAILLVNAHAAALFGYEPAALVGKPVDVVLAGFPCDIDAFDSSARLEAPIEGQAAKALQRRATRKDGSEFRAEVLVTAIRHGYGWATMGSVRDISEPAEDAARFRGVLDAADDAAVGIDKSGLISLVNPEAEELFKAAI